METFNYDYDCYPKSFYDERLQAASVQTSTRTLSLLPSISSIQPLKGSDPSRSIKQFLPAHSPTQSLLNQQSANHLKSFDPSGSMKRVSPLQSPTPSLWNQQSVNHFKSSDPFGPIKRFSPVQSPAPSLLNKQSTNPLQSLESLPSLPALPSEHASKSSELLPSVNLLSSAQLSPTSLWHDQPIQPQPVYSPYDLGEYYGLDMLYGEDENYSRSTRCSSCGDTGSDSSSTSSSSCSSYSSSSHSQITEEEKYEPPPKQKTLRKPSFADTFRVLYLNKEPKRQPSGQFLDTKPSKMCTVDEFVKGDRLGCKKWLSQWGKSTEHIPKVVKHDPEIFDNRVKVDAQFLKDLKKQKLNKRISPAAKLKWWELMCYKKLGFIQPV